MKTAETHTTATQHRPEARSAEGPFFQRDAQRSFFGGERVAEPFFSPATIQPKLKIGAPDDAYEREADQVADRVVQRLAQPGVDTLTSEPSPVGVQAKLSSAGSPVTRPLQRQSAPESEEELQMQEEEAPIRRKAIFDSAGEDEGVQRKCASCGTQEEGMVRRLPMTGAGVKFIQRTCAACAAQEEVRPKRVPGIQRAGDGSLMASGAFSSQLQASKGGGQSLPKATQASMGSAMGSDFSGVRVHTGSEAASLSNSIGAQAFTHGSDVYFNEGKYDPGSSSGQHLLAHELTHTVQQGGAKSTPSVQADFLDDAWNATTGFVDSTIEAGSEFVGDVADTVSETVDAGIEAATEVGESLIKEVLDRYAPGLWDMINNGIDGPLKEKIVESIMRLVRRLKTKLEGSDIVAKIREAFSNSKEKLKEWQERVTEGCDSMYDQIEALIEFFGELFGEKIEELKQDLQLLSGYASEFWNKLGLPDWDAIKELAGQAWDWLQRTATWIWNVTAPVRDFLMAAWEWIKEKLGLLQDSATSVWDKLKEIALSVWEQIKPHIEPFIKPLTVIGGILLALSPMGPIALIYLGATRGWDALKWIKENWEGWETLVALKDYFANSVLPAIRETAQAAISFIKDASSWISGIVASIRQAITEFMDALGVLDIIEGIQAFMAEIRLLFDDIKGEFLGFIETLREEFNEVLNAAGSLLSTVWECARPILDFVLGIIAIGSNPGLWPVYAGALAGKLIWMALPHELKIAAIDFIIDLLRSTIEFVRLPGILDQVWSIFRTGALSFLNQIDSYSPDQKIQFVDNLLTLLVDPQTYGAFLRGLVAGFVDQAVTVIAGIVSLSVNLPSILTSIVNTVKNMATDISELENTLQDIVDVTTELQDYLNEESLSENIVSFFEEAPGKLSEWFDETIESGVDFAERTGKDFADKLFNFVLNIDNNTVGYQIGDFVGRIVFEILLTKGIGFVVGKITQGINMLRRGLTAISGRAKTLAVKIFEKIKEIFRGIFRQVRRLFQKLGRRFEALFDRLKNRFDRLIQWIIRMFKGSAENILQWEAFKFAVGRMTAATNAGYEGVTRDVAYNNFRPILTTFSQIAGVPLLSGLTRKRKLVQEEENSGYWHLKARKRFGIIDPSARIVGTEVGKILIKKVIPGVGQGRWDRGRDAVRARISDGFSEAEFNKSSLDRAFKEIKENYKFSRLEAEWDESEQDWNIMGSMSPKKVLGKVGGKNKVQQSISKPIVQKVDTTDVELGEVKEATVEAPRSSKPVYGGTTAQDFGTSMRIDFLSKRPAIGESGQPAGLAPSNSTWDILLRRRAPRRSYYVRGHLLSQKLHGPAQWRNLSPLTQNANTQLHERNVESPIKQALEDGTRFFSYEVYANYGRRFNSSLYNKFMRDSRTLEAQVVENEQYVPLNFSCRAQEIDINRNPVPGGLVINYLVRNTIEQKAKDYHAK